MPEKKTCFVIQPLCEKYKARYDLFYRSAIEAAGLSAYRVDKDPSVGNIIAQIQEKIKAANICFAEISEDNPNVWYELGYAHAHGHEVVMVRQKGKELPFDIKPENTILYNETIDSDSEHRESIVRKIKKALEARIKITKPSRNAKSAMQQRDRESSTLSTDKKNTAGHGAPEQKHQSTTVPEKQTVTFANVSFEQNEIRILVKILSHYSRDKTAITGSDLKNYFSISLNPVIVDIALKKLESNKLITIIFYKNTMGKTRGKCIPGPKAMDFVHQYPHLFKP